MPEHVVCVYLRISANRTSEHASIDRQRADCLAHAARLPPGRLLEFVDESYSAYQDRQRPAYQRLLEQLQNTPQPTVVVWHLDRLYRRPAELEQLLDVLDTRPVRIESVQGGMFDLNTHEGRLFARQLVAFANYESAHAGARVARAQQHRAQHGLLHGGRRYGHRSTGALHPRESFVIRRIVNDYLIGLSPTVIARELTTAKIRTPAGHGRWGASTIEGMLRSDRLHGYRSTTEGVFEGAWDRLVSLRESMLIRAHLLAPRRDAARSSKHLLSGIARCGTCMNRLVSAVSRHGEPLYRCKASPSSCGLLTAPAEFLEVAAVEHLATHVEESQNDSSQPLSPASILEGLQQETGALRALATGYGAGRLSRSEFYAQRTDTLQRFAEYTTELKKHLRVHVINHYPDPAAHMPALTISRQRMIVDALLGPIVVHRDGHSWRALTGCCGKELLRPSGRVPGGS